MLSYTHIVIGVSASLALVEPNNKAQSLVVIGAASVGSIASDLDVKINKYSIDALYGRFMVMVILAAVALVDMQQRLGIYNYYVSLKGPTLYIGMFSFSLVILGCIFSSHRGFSHSFLALGFCLNLFYSSKIANKIFFLIGCVILAKLLLIYL